MKPGRWRKKDWLVPLVALLFFAPFFSLDFGLIHLPANPALAQYLEQANPLSAFAQPLFVNHPPLVILSWWIEARLPGIPPGWHGTAVAVHALNAGLLLALLRRLRIPGAFALALLFSVHPVALETLAWPLNRTFLFSFLFILLLAQSLLASLRQRGGGLGAQLSWSAAALCSGTAALTLPGVAGLFLLYATQAKSKRLFPRVVPILLLVIAFAIVKLRTGPPPDLVQLPATAEAAAAWQQALPTAGLLLEHYFGKSVFPASANIYQVPPIAEVQVVDVTQIKWLLVLYPFLVTLLFAFRHAPGRAAALGLGWFLLLIFPSLLIVPEDGAGGAIATAGPAYPAFMGLLVFLFAGLKWVFARFLAGWRWLYVAPVSILMALLIFVSGLGMSRMLGREAYLRTLAEESEPDDWLPRYAHAEYLLRRAGSSDRQSALRTEASNILDNAILNAPGALPPYLRLADLQISDERLRDAENTLEAAREIAPEDRRLKEKLATVYRARGRPALAESLLGDDQRGAEGRMVRPDDGQLVSELRNALESNALERAERIAAEIDWAGLDPGPRHRLQARLALSRGNMQAAAREILLLAELDTASAASAYLQLADAYADAGLKRRALASYTQAYEAGARAFPELLKLVELAATRNNASARQRELALEVAREATTRMGNEDPRALSALALAQAANGDLGAAVKNSSAAIARLEALGSQTAADAERDRLSYYASDQPVVLW